VYTNSCSCSPTAVVIWAAAEAVLTSANKKAVLQLGCNKKEKKKLVDAITLPRTAEKKGRKKKKLLSNNAVSKFVQLLKLV
jgi:hypothetical protein